MYLIYFRHGKITCLLEGSSYGRKTIKVWMDKLVVSRSIRNNIGIGHEKQYWEVAVCAITVNVSCS